MSIKKIAKCLMIFTLISSIFIPFSKSTLALNESYDLTYVGISEFGLDTNTSQTAVFNLQNQNYDTYTAYCVDLETSIIDYSKYARMNLEDAQYYSNDDAAHIRSIVKKSYPYVSIQELQTLTSIFNLTTQEAISATQLAIWSHSNSNSETSTNPNVNALLAWYLALPIDNSPTTPVADIVLNQTVSSSLDKYSALFSFKANGHNSDSSPVQLTYQFDKDIVAQFGATITDLGIDDEGFQKIHISNLGLNDTFTINVSGSQVLDQDVYFYESENGRHISQSLVGLYQGVNNISSTSQYSNFEANNEIIINKIDSITLLGLQGAVFEVSNTINFDDIVITLTTEETGIATYTGISKGTWYVRETIAPVGYIPYTDIFTISIGDGVNTFDFKNAAYSSLKIIKVDDHGSAVEGAKFSLYEGHVVDENKLLYFDLETNYLGEILVNDLLPGDYTLLETYVPVGYVLNSTPQPITLIAKEIKEVTIINRKIKNDACLYLIKKDKISDIQMAGSIIGIYTDSSYNNKIAEITTKKNEPVSVCDLAPNTYYVKELVAPVGYLLDSAPQTVLLEESQEATLIFKNTRIPVTAANYATILLISTSVLVILLLFLGFIIYKRKNNEKKVCK